MEDSYKETVLMKDSYTETVQMKDSYKETVLLRNFFYFCSVKYFAGVQSDKN